MMRKALNIARRPLFPCIPTTSENFIVFCRALAFFTLLLHQLDWKIKSRQNSLPQPLRPHHHKDTVIMSMQSPSFWEGLFSTFHYWCDSAWRVKGALFTSVVKAGPATTIEMQCSVVSLRLPHGTGCQFGYRIRQNVYVSPFRFILP